MPPTTEELRKFFEDRYERANKVGAAHYLLAGRYVALHRTFGAVVVVITTAVGAITATFDEMNTFIIIASMVSAVLAGLQLFLAYEKQSEQHRITGARYSSFKRESEEKVLFVDTITQDIVDEFGKRWDSLTSDAPIIPDWVWDHPKMKDRNFSLKNNGSIT